MNVTVEITALNGEIWRVENGEIKYLIDSMADLLVVIIAIVADGTLNRNER